MRLHQQLAAATLLYYKKTQSTHIEMGGGVRTIATVDEEADFSSGQGFDSSHRPFASVGFRVARNGNISLYYQLPANAMETDSNSTSGNSKTDTLEGREGGY